MITRIEIREFPNQTGLSIKKYGRNWSPKSLPDSITKETKLSIEEIEKWLIDHGWTVYKWSACEYLGIPKGIRAFKGKPRSVRTKYQMKKYRRELEKRVNDYLRTPESYKKPIPEVVGKIHVIDLAYEL